jgi:3-(3-hydroxy-phenyl)propionate hydroxylase
VCHKHGITPVRITAEPDTSTDTTRIDARLTPAGTTGLQALADDPSLTILVRPDRVIAAMANRCQPPRLPWTLP